MYSTINESAIIVCDLGGVLFTYHKHEIYALLNEKARLSPFKPIARMVALIQRYHDCVDAQGNRIHQFYVLSNFSLKAFDVLLHYHKPILDLFDGIVLSARVGYSKPDPRIYVYLLHTYRLNASDCIFIDDEPRKVKVAQDLGMRGIVYRGAAYVEHELKRLGVM